MTIERKITIQLDTAEDNLFTEFLDFLEDLTNKMDEQKMHLDANSFHLLNDLNNAFSLLDRAYTTISEEEI